MRHVILTLTLSLFLPIALALFLTSASQSSVLHLQPDNRLAPESDLTMLGKSLEFQSIETLYLETRLNGQNNPLLGTVPLETNNPYVIQVTGTWSAWYASGWSSYCGSTEDSPMIPSPGVQNGIVGIDAAYTFASPLDSAWCSLPDPPPWRWNDFEISLDGGTNWQKVDPISGSYNENHVYDYYARGQGVPARFRIFDVNYVDNYGILKIDIRQSCEVPFFWQRDPNGIKDHPLRGTCGTNFDTIGEGGCTMTSATMLFRSYGADTTTDNTEMTPPTLSDCMDTSACPFNWVSGAACSNGKASNPRRDKSFSYQRLDQELNQNHRPIILQMCRPKGACDWDGPFTHWVLVVGGQGTDPANYSIWDPWFECGENMRLNSRSETWDFVGMAVYDGTPTCSFSTEVPLCAQSISPVGLPSGVNDIVTEQNAATPIDLMSSSTISGTATLYRTTNITMTVHLSAQSSVGNVTEMLIWSDSTPNTTWQPFAPYVWLPLSDLVYAQFRDDIGNISAIVSDTPNPSAPPVAPDPYRSYLPSVIK